MVAEEVRKLAEQSNEAARQVQTIIGEIQERTKSATKDTEQTVTLIGEAMGTSTTTAVRIREIVPQIAEISEGVQSIAASSQEQLASNEEIAAAMDNILHQVGAGQRAADMVEKASRKGGADGLASVHSGGAGTASRSLVEIPPCVPGGA